MMTDMSLVALLRRIHHALTSMHGFFDRIVMG